MSFCLWSFSDPGPDAKEEGVSTINPDERP
jgi:hypothetical protein